MESSRDGTIGENVVECISTPSGNEQYRESSPGLAADLSRRNGQGGCSSKLRRAGLT
jgi:hypothetical protein